MTEKTLLVENPFSFQQDQKLFIQQLEQLQEEEQPQDDLMDIPQGPKGRLCKQPKKYGIIRALDEEAEKIAKAREEILLKDMQSGKGGQTKGRHKGGSKSMKLWDVSDYEPKKGVYKVKSLLKEKKETIGEFIKKKRQIMLQNIMIDNKKEETERLKEFIKNEEESLKARNQYFVRDQELVTKFMADVKQAAENATKEAEAEAKRKEILKSDISRQLVAIDQCENKNERLRDDIDQLIKYKQFIELARKNMEGMIEEKKKTQAMRKKKQMEIQAKMSQQQQASSHDPNAFITQPQSQQQQQSQNQSQTQSLQQSGQNSLSQSQSSLSQEPSQQLQHLHAQQAYQDLTKSSYFAYEETEQKFPGIDFEPGDLVDFLDSIEEQNLRYIHDKFEAESVLTSQESELKELEFQLKTKKAQNAQKIKELKKQLVQAQGKKKFLEELHLINTDKVKFTEGAELRFEEIRDKIEQIHSQFYQKERTGKQDYKEKEKEKTDKNEKHEVNSQIMKQKMLEIEQKIYEITKETDQMEIEDPLLFKKIKTKQKHHKDKLKDEDLRKMVLQDEKFRQRELKRQQAVNNLRKGRVIMNRIRFQEKQQQKEESVHDNTDDDEKFLNSNFELGQDIKPTK